MLGQEKSRRSQTVVQLLSQPEDVLSAIVLGNTPSNASVVIIGFVALRHTGWSIWLTASGPFVLLLLLFCEVTPKALAVREPKKWARRCAVPLAIVVAHRPASPGRPAARAAGARRHRPGHA
jgi:Mg2+/Co2+ transporter CorB